MANNRLYLVDRKTGKYICLAKKYGNPSWDARNLDLYQSFLSNAVTATDDGTSLFIGAENDDEFYDEWIKNGDNYNTENKWE
jgi:hypothetical protein